MPIEYADLRETVMHANQDLPRLGLAILTWGNVSVVDRRMGVYGINPSGVACERLRPEDIVVLSLEDGRVISGILNSPSDSPTHLILYRHFCEVQCVVHVHSEYATAWAQAGREIPCLGTTHADVFRGAVPLARPLRDAEVDSNYETHVGAAIVEWFARHGVPPLERPAALVPGHGPFVWGPSPRAALETAVALEMIARMAAHTLAINPETAPLGRALSEHHFLRKRGLGRTYGQPSFNHDKSR